MTMMTAPTTDTRTVISLDIGGTKIAGAVLRVDTASPADAPRVLSRETMPTMAERGGAGVLRRVAGLAVGLMRRCGGGHGDDGAVVDGHGNAVAGIGVSAAGVIDANGCVASATGLMPGWAGIPLGAALHEATGLPVRVMGDVHAHALGESLWGAGRGLASMLLVAVGTGVGGAVVTDGAVLYGAHHVGGHIGHVLHPAALGLVCSCGREGHVEAVASGSGIEARYAAATGVRASGGEIARRAAEGEAAAIDVLGTAGRALGEVLGSQANVIDPEAVVLSGSVCAAGRCWLDAVRAGYRDQAMDVVADVPIVLGALGGDAPLFGAVASYIKEGRQQTCNR